MLCKQGRNYKINTLDQKNKKYLDRDHLDKLRIDFAQLPSEIYKLKE